MMTDGEFIKGVADYIETHTRWPEMTKREAVEAAVRLLTTDIGAAHSFLHVIGVPYDMYDRRVVAPDADCYTLPNGECIAEQCRLHGPLVTP